MKVSLAAALPALALLVLAGCQSGGFAYRPPTVTYVSPTTPAAALWDLQMGFDTRNAAQVEGLLAPGFVYHFRSDSLGLPDSMLRAELHNFLEHFFLTGGADTGVAPAPGVHLVLDTVSVRSDNRLGHPGWARADVNMDLEVTFPDGSSRAMNGPASLYLRQVPEGSGTWMLAEWDDFGQLALLVKRYRDPGPPEATTTSTLSNPSRPEAHP